MFGPFNRFFKASSDKYHSSVARILKRRSRVFAVYALLLFGTGLMFNVVPRGFIPTQDKLYLIAGVKLPEGASLERTDAVLKKVVEIAKNTEGVANVPGMIGLNPTQFTNTPNYGVAFPILKPFNERHRSAKEIADEIQEKISAHQGRYGLHPDAAADPGHRRRVPVIRCSSRIAPVLATARCRTQSARCKAR